MRTFETTPKKVQEARIKIKEDTLETTILDKIKWNDYPPSPPTPQSNDEGAKEQKRAISRFGIIEMGGGVVEISHLFCPWL